MKKVLVLLSACMIGAFQIGCAHEKYGEYSVQAINSKTGIASGMTKNGELLVLERDEQRQAIYIPNNRVGDVQIFNCSEAPVMYVKINLFGRKHCSILRVELPARKTDLKYYRHREVGNNVTWKGKKAWIIDLKEVSPDGKSIRVVFDVENDHKRRTGDYFPASNVLSDR
ncbi:MAG: hypothetical protein E7040_01285 [Lentisphaerae bacterium]|nr:hypothetical protein [Lentisphaerota bacterium]